MNTIKKDIITYTIDRARNAGFYISIEKGEVIVKAPWYVTNKSIQEIVEEKKKWITEKLRQYEDQNISQRNYIKNKKAQIFGTDYNVIIKYENEKYPKLDIEENKIKITLPNKYKKSDNQDIINILLEKMYNKIAEEEIANQMEKNRIKLGFAPEDYEIKRMKKEFAKCTEDKKIIVNPDIVTLSKEKIEVILLHEFCHIKYKTHGKGFYNLMRRCMPDYKKYEAMF